MHSAVCYTHSCCGCARSQTCADIGCTCGWCDTHLLWGKLACSTEQKHPDRLDLPLSYGSKDRAVWIKNQVVRQKAQASGVRDTTAHCVLQHKRPLFSLLPPKPQTRHASCVMTETTNTRFHSPTTLTQPFRNPNPDTPTHRASANMSP